MKNAPKGTLFVFANFGWRRDNPSGARLELPNGWIDLNGTFYDFGQSAAINQSIQANCSENLPSYTVVKEISFDSSVVLHFLKALEELRMLMAAYALALGYPLTLFSIFAISPTGPSPTELTVFGASLPGRKMDVSQITEAFYASGSVFTEGPPTFQFNDVLSWHEYLMAERDSLFRHEIILSGFRAICIGFHNNNPIEKRYQIAQGSISMVSGLEGLLLLSKKTRQKATFTEIGLDLYLSGCNREGRTPEDSVLMRKRISHLYGVRSDFAHSKFDVFGALNAPSPGGGGAFSKFFKSYNIMGGPSPGTYNLALGLVWEDIFTILKQRKFLGEAAIITKLKKIKDSEALCAQCGQAIP